MVSSVGPALLFLQGVGGSSHYQTTGPVPIVSDKGSLVFSFRECQLLVALPGLRSATTGVFSRCFLTVFFIFTAFGSPCLFLAAFPYKLWFRLQMCSSLLKKEFAFLFFSLILGDFRYEKE